MALVSTVQPPLRISDAIRRASEATGTDFDYLLTTAARESNFKPEARASTSSAAGLFQFIESTWLQTVKEQGGRFGLEKYSPHIFRTESGRYYVPNRELRQEILNLRHNPEISALMAGAFTQENARYVGDKLGRAPTQGELYIAHFLGAGGATKLITLASKDPHARADTHFPRAARANRSIFYSHRQARSVRQVYDQLVGDHSRFGAMAVAVSTPGQSRSVQTIASGQPQARAHPDPTLRMSVLNDATSSVTARYAADPVKTIAPMSRTRVAALTWSPIPVGAETMTDASLGAIGQWRTIVRPEPAAASASETEITPSQVAEPVAAHFRIDPARVPLRTRLHGGAPTADVSRGGVQVASREGAAPAQSNPALRNFSSRFWELQALTGG